MIIGTGGIRCFDLNTNFGGFPLIWYSTFHFFNFLITSSKWALFNISVICPWWPWCQQSNYIRNLMFKVWIMHDVWFLNRRRVLKTPHPIFIFFISLLKETWPFVYINLKALWKDVTGHLTWAFCSGELKRLEATTSIYVFFNFLVLYDCIRTFQAVCCTWFCLEIMTIKRSTGMSFYIGGGG